ncbi:unnamed protein product [Parnassius apollo]|uniref:(apollo) hypothetical protein n=1 Tax=Parnassius apollo TaxID=110799 RepID=A0A8S3VZD7_PARAO|nr:unnamed protein product [Parnassius apollo]
MKTGRSKLMLKLVEETSKNSKKCHSPLPPGARNVIEEMNDICEDVFSDDIHRTSKIIKSTNENMDPNIPASTCVLEEDPFMAVYENASSPYLLASENQHGVVSLLNITSALTPLNTSTLISDLSPFPQPITPTVDNNGQTPMPSPVKTHGEVCNDFLCSTHDGADIATVNQTSTAVSSYQLSRAPLIRCRGKKRVRNYDDWVEIKRKRLANAGKEYIFKKGVIVQAKAIGRPCTCRYKCYTMLTLEERQDAFEKFWKLGDREKQWLHVANYTTKQKKKRGLQRDLKHNRQFTYNYFFAKGHIKNRGF